MPKPTSKERLQRPDRGLRYRMMLELEEGDDEQLGKLVTRYRKLLGGAMKPNKAFVIRQLIRHAAAHAQLPPIRE